MKYAIGWGDHEVEITKFNKFEKGSLKGFFDILVHPHGQKISDCRYFNMNEKAWFNFPQKEVKKQDGTKEYFDIVSIANKEYSYKFREAVLKALKENDHAGSQATSTQSKSSFRQGENQVKDFLSIFPSDALF